MNGSLLVVFCTKRETYFWDWVIRLRGKLQCVPFITLRRVRQINDVDWSFYFQFSELGTTGTLFFQLYECMYVHICTWMYIHVHICTYKRIYIHSMCHRCYMYTCVHICVRQVLYMFLIRHLLFSVTDHFFFSFCFCVCLVCVLFILLLSLVGVFVFFHFVFSCFVLFLFWGEMWRSMCDDVT